MSLLTLPKAYLAISIDTAGLVRVSAFWVLRKGGKYGHRLYFYLYTFFFCLGTFIGNVRFILSPIRKSSFAHFQDPIILSGTAFLAYMTRAASNIRNPRAWITAQFAVANISSAILVSSNPTNLVLAGAFDIKFIDYTVNMVSPSLVKCTRAHMSS
jgi:Na+/H+ antiporter NhaD/arsenite permease-like protein